jgi:threonyl-tRNA synthetase
VFKIYADFGFKDVIVEFSTRPEKRVGSDEQWDKAEQALELALNHKGLDWRLYPGEGAFYGPKADFSLKDSLERVWQCGTIQVDFSMPGRLGAQYVAEDGSRQVPVMLHRAILGSVERFIGILIEEYAGSLPVWLAPVQVALLNITDKQLDYTQDIGNRLKQRGFRVITDLRNEKIGFKIREHTLQRVPYLLVIGNREVQDGTVAVRMRSGEDLGVMTAEVFSERLTQEIASRGI